MTGETEAAFVADARKRWHALLDKTDTMPASSMALAVSLWATMNVDRLLDIAQKSIVLSDPSNAN